MRVTCVSTRPPSRWATPAAHAHPARRAGGDDDVSAGRAAQRLGRRRVGDVARLGERRAADAEDTRGAAAADDGGRRRDIRAHQADRQSARRARRECRAGRQRLERGPRQRAIGSTCARTSTLIAESTPRSPARSASGDRSFTTRVSRRCDGTAALAKVPAIATGAGLAFCSAGISVRMFAMPELRVVGRLAQMAGRPAQHGRRSRRTSTPGAGRLRSRSRISSEPVGADRHGVDALELIDDAEPLADHLQASRRPRATPIPSRRTAATASRSRPGMAAMAFASDCRPHRPRR